MLNLESGVIKVEQALQFIIGRHHILSVERLLCKVTGARNGSVSCLPSRNVSGFSFFSPCCSLTKADKWRCRTGQFIFSRLQSELSLELRAVDCEGLLTAQV